MRDAGVAQDRQRRLHEFDVILAAEQLQIALAAAIVERITATEFVQTLAAVISDALHALLVDAKAFEVAFAQPARDPAPLSRIEGGAEDQRRGRLEQIFEYLRRH